MSIDNSKDVRCKRPLKATNNQVLSVSPHSGGEMLHLSFFCGDLYCSNSITKDEAREFAENILKLLEEIADSNPNQESLDLQQQEAA